MSATLFIIKNIFLDWTNLLLIASLIFYLIFIATWLGRIPIFGAKANLVVIIGLISLILFRFMENTIVDLYNTSYGKFYFIGIGIIILCLIIIFPSAVKQIAEGTIKRKYLK